MAVVQEEVKGSGPRPLLAVTNGNFDKHPGLVGVVSQVKAVTFFVFVVDVEDRQGAEYLLEGDEGGSV